MHQSKNKFQIVQNLKEFRKIQHWDLYKMQFEAKIHDKKILNLILGKQSVQKIKQLSILLVGVGGIGCQALKCICKLPIKKVTIIDLDTIQTSNLNRQFYFKKQHVSKSKAEIAKQEILKIAPNLSIEAIQGSIYDSNFDNCVFYSQFSVIISALDNMKARQHVAKNATKYSKILIDAGTAGFHGQSYTSIRFLTSCHNCYPSVTEENFAVCTIRNKPEKEIHCAVYAKNIVEQFFGAEQDDFLDQKVKKIKQKSKQLSKDLMETDIGSLAVQLFDYLFSQQLIQNWDENGKDILKDKVPQPKINLLKFKQAIYKDVLKDNQVTTVDQILGRNIYQSKGQKIVIREDTIWTLRQYAYKFVQSFLNLVRNKSQLSRSGQNQKSLRFSYDKDDQDCCIFVNCITNLRIYNFKDYNKSRIDQEGYQRKMKYLTFYDCRKTLGKIIPAIASTNSIAAALQIKQMVDMARKPYQSPRYYTISPLTDQKISFSFISLANPQCKFCSPKNFYFQIECRLSATTFGQFQDFAQKNCLLKGRDIYCKDLIVIKNVNANRVSPNKEKSLDFKKKLMQDDTMTVYFEANSKISDTRVQVILIDVNVNFSEKKFKIINQRQILRTKEMYQQFKLAQIHNISC